MEDHNYDCGKVVDRFVMKFIHSIINYIAGFIPFGIGYYAFLQLFATP